MLLLLPLLMLQTLQLRPCPPLVGL
jgi:hypothetical protein